MKPGFKESSELSCPFEELRSAARCLGQTFTNFWPVKLVLSLFLYWRSSSKLCNLRSCRAFTNESDFYFN